MEIPRITANGLKYMNLQEKKFISILNEFDNKYYEVLKEEIEEILLNTDWDDVALKKLAKKDEWAHLNFFEQSAWTTKFLGLPEERFKLNPWNL